VVRGRGYAPAVARLKQHTGRKRRIAGWFVLAWAVAFAGLWVASRRWVVYVSWRGSSIQSLSGVLFIYTPQTPVSNPLKVRSVSNRGSPLWMWWYWHRVPYITLNPPVSSVAFPGWLIPGVLTIVGVPLLRSGIIARRARVGLCKKCHYDLRGLPPGSPCPECGTAA
jgi:hypothetical protein